MCGRYLFSDAESEDIREIIRDVEDRVGAGAVGRGEIFPTDRAPILLGRDQSIRPELVSWGFPGFNNKGVIINSRAETAHEKPTFRKSLMTMRCIVPSSGFYEWDHSPGLPETDTNDIEQRVSKKPVKKAKQKYLFSLPDEKVLYMAGLYNIYGGEAKFVILTTGANASVAEVHDRMPLILRKELLSDWLFDTSRALELLSEAPLLRKTAV